MNDNDNDMTLIIMQTCTQVDNKLGPRKVPASLRGAGGREVFSGNHPFSPFLFFFRQVFSENHPPSLFPDSHLPLQRPRPVHFLF